jgi:hypothetical protein
MGGIMKTVTFTDEEVAAIRLWAALEWNEIDGTLQEGMYMDEPEVREQKIDAINILTLYTRS